MTTFIGVSVGQGKKNEAIKYSALGIVILVIVVAIEELVLWKY